MKPFIIASRPRCGTHMLASSLDNHPDIDCYLEELGAGPKKLPPNFEKDNSVKTTLKAMFDSDKTTGFILHDADGRNLKVRNKLFNSYPNVKVIILFRKDVLARYISNEVAFATDKWQLFKDEENIQQKIKIDLNHMFDFFKESEFSIMRDLIEYWDYKNIIISYEDLNYEYKTTMSKVFEFLGEKCIKVEPKTLKQNKNHLYNLVKNYKEVEKAIASTKWSYLLNRDIKVL